MTPRSSIPRKCAPAIIFDFDSRTQVIGIEILGFKSNLPDANLKEFEFKIA